jgi:hypothetical protein
MTGTTSATDKGLGVGLLFGMLAVAGAVGMFVAAAQPADQQTAAIAFALAIAMGVLSVGAIHAYWD